MNRRKTALRKDMFSAIQSTAEKYINNLDEFGEVNYEWEYEK